MKRKLKDIINTKTAIHCDTEERTMALLKELENRGYEWNSGHLATEWNPYQYEEKAICIAINDRHCWFGNKIRYEEVNYTIVEFEDVDFED